MSMFNIQGIVTTVSYKPWNDRKSGREITLHSFQVQGEKRWFRTGETNPNLNEGEYIEFTFDTQNGNVDVSTITKGAAPSQPAQSNGGQRTSGSNGGGGQQSAPRGNTTKPATGGSNTREDYWTQKANEDKAKDARYQSNDIPRMSFSASQDRAVHLVSAALDNDALSFGTVAKGKKLDMLLEYVDLVTDRFFLQSMNSPEHLVSIGLEDGRVVDTDVQNLGGDFDE